MYDLLEKIDIVSVESCTCEAKIADVKPHHDLCRYRVLKEVHEELQLLQDLIPQESSKRLNSIKKKVDHITNVEIISRALRIYDVLISIYNDGYKFYLKKLDYSLEYILFKLFTSEPKVTEDSEIDPEKLDKLAEEEFLKDVKEKNIPITHWGRIPNVVKNDYRSRARLRLQAGRLNDLLLPLGTEVLEELKGRNMKDVD